MREGEAQVSIVDQGQAPGVADIDDELLQQDERIEIWWALRIHMTRGETWKDDRRKSV